MSDVYTYDQTLALVEKDIMDAGCGDIKIINLPKIINR